MGRESFVRKPDRTVLSDFVASVLSHCHSLGPKYISVPQLPVTTGSERNKINRELATVSEKWRTDGKHRARFILPLIFTHPDQYKGKTAWKKKIALVEQCLERCRVEWVWVVDASLNDQEGRGTFRQRFEHLAGLHQDLKEAVGGREVLAGPYWSMNLVLWARGLARPAIGVGGGYRYYLPGGPPPTAAVVRLAIPPIRQQAKATQALRGWLDDAAASLPHSDPVRKELEGLRHTYRAVPGKRAARDQVARFYRDWLNRLEFVKGAGRGFLLYQDLSSAFVLLKRLPKFPRNVMDAGRPDKAIEMLMSNCL